MKNEVLLHRRILKIIIKKTLIVSQTKIWKTASPWKDSKEWIPAEEKNVKRLQRKQLTPYKLSPNHRSMKRGKELNEKQSRRDANVLHLSGYLTSRQCRHPAWDNTRVNNNVGFAQREVNWPLPPLDWANSAKREH